MAKTNATRLLDLEGISYRLIEYEVDPEHLDAESVAAKVGIPAEQVFKTLVARGDRHGVCFAVIPGDMELDLKALARVTEDRKMEMVHLREVQTLTGYIRGGVTVPGARKAYPVYLDETAILFDWIAVSAGMRGLQMVLSTNDYIRATHAALAAISREKSARAG